MERKRERINVWPFYRDEKFPYNPYVVKGGWGKGGKRCFSGRQPSISPPLPSFFSFTLSPPRLVAIERELFYKILKRGACVLPVPWTDTKEIIFVSSYFEL